MHKTSGSLKDGAWRGPKGVSKFCGEIQSIKTGGAEKRTKVSPPTPPLGL